MKTRNKELKSLSLSVKQYARLISSMKHFLPIVAVSATFSACKQELKSGINLDNLDVKVRPADNFYQYACGGWMSNNPLPKAYSRYGSFEKLNEDNDKRIKDIIEELKEKDFPAGSVERKLSDLYHLATDSLRRNDEGIAPIMPIINALENAQTKEELFDIQIKLTAEGDQEFYHIFLGADEKNVKENIVNISQGGITLGQREYYLDNDSATEAIRQAYKQHIVDMFHLFGFDKEQSQSKMTNIMEIETRLAEVSRTMTELRDPEKNYNKTTLNEFSSRYPNLRFIEITNAMGLKTEHLEELVVGQPEFLDGANKVLSQITVAQYRDYMEWGQIMSYANYLSDEIAEANFNFFGRVLAGRKEMHPLWKRATDQVQSEMGEVLGKMYVERYFPATSKERMENLVENLRQSLVQRIEEQTWMSDSTKKNALEKLATFYVKIGYPDKWTDFSDLNINSEKSYAENIMECKRFWLKWQIDTKAGKPVDIEEWFMYPQTVNAYYNPTTNEICFPAGILQPPFFDAQADDAYNYGAIGVVIGHEMTHGFDDQGRHYDKDGNLFDWWTKEDAENFNSKAQGYANFFSNIDVLPGLKANGQLTLGENLADHGGLQVAFNAYKNVTANKSLPDINGLTADQRFFIAYASVWAANITEEEIRQRTKSDPHALGRWRVNGALPHINAWYEAFNVTPEDSMYIPQEERLDLW